MFEVRTDILGKNCYGSQYLTDAIGKDIPIVHRVVRSYTEEDKKLKAKNKKAGYVFSYTKCRSCSRVLIRD